MSAHPYTAIGSKTTVAIYAGLLISVIGHVSILAIVYWALGPFRAPAQSAAYPHTLVVAIAVPPAQLPTPVADAPSSADRRQRIGSEPTVVRRAAISAVRNHAPRHPPALTGSARASRAVPRRAPSPPPAPAAVSARPAPPPAHSPGPVATPESTLQRQRYLADLLRALDRHKSYPLKARRLGREGRVVLRVTVRRDGKITGAVVAESSGVRTLDRAAVKAARRLDRFRPFPRNLSGQVLSTDAVFRFNLYDQQAG